MVEPSHGIFYMEFHLMEYSTNGKHKLELSRKSINRCPYHACILADTSNDLNSRRWDSHITTPMLPLCLLSSTQKITILKT